MIRAALLVLYFGIYTIIAGLIAFPVMFATGSVEFLYRIATSGALFGTRLVGVRWEPIGRERLDPRQTYIFMSNHTSNIDPPVFVPLIGRRVFVLVKKELLPDYRFLGMPCGVPNSSKWTGAIAMRRWTAFAVQPKS